MNTKTISLLSVCMLMVSGAFLCCSLTGDDSSAGGTLHQSVNVGTWVDFSYTETDDGWDVCEVDVVYDLPGMNYSMSGNTVRIYGTPQAAGRYEINVITFYPWDEIEGGFLMWVDVTNPSRTVTYNANGGSCGTSSATVNTGSSVSLPAASKAEYTFKGWYTESSGGSRVGGAGDAYTVNSDVTLYAQYDAIPVSITSSQGNYSMVRGNTFSYNVNCNLSGCSISVSGANWLSVNGTTITGTPSAAGDYSITVTAAKAGHTSATQTFTIHVADILVFTSSPSSGFIVVS